MDPTSPSLMMMLSFWKLTGYMQSTISRICESSSFWRKSLSRIACRINARALHMDTYNQGRKWDAWCRDRDLCWPWVVIRGHVNYSEAIISQMVLQSDIARTSSLVYGKSGSLKTLVGLGPIRFLGISGKWAFLCMHINKKSPKCPKYGLSICVHRADEANSN